MKKNFHFRLEKLAMGNRKRKPRVASGPLPAGAWREKLSPIFIKVAELERKVAALSRSDKPEDIVEAGRLMTEVRPELSKDAAFLRDSMKPKGQIRHLGYLQALGVENLPPGTTISEAEYVLRWLCWFRFGKTLQVLTSEYESGDVKAIKQMNKLNLEYDMLRFGEVNPNKLRFKTDVDHFMLMTCGLDLGLENLSSEELAECFDEFCPCGRSHFPENLAKLRLRIIKEFPPVPLL